MQLLPHPGQFQPIGGTENLVCKIIQANPKITTALDARPGVSGVKITIRGHLESFDGMVCGRTTFHTRGPDILEQLIEITGGTGVVMGTQPGPRCDR